MNIVQIIPIEGLPIIETGDNIAELVCDAARRQGTPIQNTDILIVTHTVVSRAEGNVVNLDHIEPSEFARSVAQQYGKDPALVEVILKESKNIVRMGNGNLITETRHGLVCANAGIDVSNVPGERNVALLPKDPDFSADTIRREIDRLIGCDVAVIVSDTHGRPLRMGEINVAIGIAGMKPIRDRRGEKDLFGYVLRVKQTAIADELCSAAELAIGQANEGIPAAIIRGYRFQKAENAKASELVRPREKDLFIWGLPIYSCLIETIDSSILLLAVTCWFETSWCTDRSTADQISGGRAILGLGAGEAMNVEPFGIEWNSPVSRLVEAVTNMRKLWSREALTYEGRFWRLKDAFLQINPVNGRVSIYFGANSPRTLWLTGEIADGWLSVPLSPKLYRERLKFVKEGAEKTGKTLENIYTGIYLYTSGTERAKDACKQINTIKSQVLPSPQMLEDAGYHIELPKELESLSYFKALADAEWIERFLQSGDLIPLDAAIEFSIAGTPEDCIKKIEEYIEAGVKHFLLMNVGPDPRQVLQFYSKEIIPHFKQRSWG